MSSSIPGAQMVGRLAKVLRAVSTSMPEGSSTIQIARVVDLPRPTVHRLLSALTEEGFCDHDHRKGLWLLGPEVYLMGAVAAERYDITSIARQHVEALADATGESAFLSARRGDETVCLLRQDGSFPIRSFVLYEGKRFPLGVASAGLAILSFLDGDAIDRYLANHSLVVEHGESHDVDTLRQRIVQTRTHGWSLNPGLIVEGSWGMGAAVFDPSGQPAWSLSLTGIESRFSAARRPEMGRLLLRHAHELTKKLCH
ncbi:IclR family transcriptional regulator [Nesterenkonia sp. Act20]|uniref:IclR family transcriptional regulator n=1 Tax=Nesterenkonia sp. Act20 TaxID=1483432 RepID=UPI00350E4958